MCGVPEGEEVEAVTPWQHPYRVTAVLKAMSKKRTIRVRMLAGWWRWSLLLVDDRPGKTEWPKVIGLHRTDCPAYGHDCNCEGDR